MAGLGVGKPVWQVIWRWRDDFFEELQNVSVSKHQSGGADINSVQQISGRGPFCTETWPYFSVCSQLRGKD